MADTLIFCVVPVSAYATMRRLTHPRHGQIGLNGKSSRVECERMRLRRCNPGQSLLKLKEAYSISLHQEQGYHGVTRGDQSCLVVLVMLNLFQVGPFCLLTWLR